MANAIYDRARKSADRMISKYGMPGFLVRRNVTGSSFDPTIGGPNRHPVMIAVLDYTSWEAKDGRVRQSDKKVLMSVGKLTIEPAVSDTVEILGVEHNIVSEDENGRGIIPLAPGGKIIFYEIHCRK